MHKNWTKTDWLRHCLILLAGLFIMAFGVAFSITADLGTSPISSVPYTISLISPLTVGTATIAMHCVFIALQILILRKKLPSLSASAAARCIYLRLSDRFCHLGFCSLSIATPTGNAGSSAASVLL